MEQMADGAFYMSNIELLIGQSSTEGERKRRARQANCTALNPGGQMSTHCLDIRPPEIEIELEIEKELERELEKGHPAPAATIRRWAKEDRRKGKGGISDYSCKEGESL